MVQPVGLKKREKYEGLGRGRSCHRGHVGGQALSQVQEMTGLKEPGYTKTELFGRSEFTDILVQGLGRAVEGRN